MRLWMVWTALAVMTMGACSSDDDSTSPDSEGSGGDTGGQPSGSDATITGSITLPGDATGACYLVGLDDDSTGANGEAARALGEVSGSTIDFSLTAPAGDYYIWVIVDLDESASTMGSCDTADVGPPNSGDYFGYYDGGLAEPSSANVSVPSSDGSPYDFSLGEFP